MGECPPRTIYNYRVLVREGDDISISHNIVFGGKKFVKTGNDTNRQQTDPLFVGAGAPTEFFSLTAESPAITSASGTMAPPKKELLFNSRGSGSAANVGAVESGLKSNQLKGTIRGPRPGTFVPPAHLLLHGPAK